MMFIWQNVQQLRILTEDPDEFGSKDLEDEVS